MEVFGHIDLNSENCFNNHGTKRNYTENARNAFPTPPIQLQCDHSHGEIPFTETTLKDGTKIIIVGWLYGELESLTSRKDFERRCDGAFSAFLADIEGIHLYRDPAGYRSLYYTIHNNRLYFASNIRLFKEKENLPLCPRREAVVDFLCTSFIPGSKTFAEDIHELPMGHRLTILPSGECKVADYCQFDLLPKLDLDVTAAADELYLRCLQNMHSIQRISPSTTACIFLSGGLDSVSTLSLAHEVYEADRLSSLSVNFGDHLPNENLYIQEALNRFGTRHEYLHVNPGNFLKEMKEIYRWIDDPIGDPVVMPNYLMNKHLGDQERMILTGEGGDPCFGGPKNVFMLATEAYKSLYGESEDPQYLERAYLESFKRCFDQLGELNALTESEFENAMTRLLNLIGDRIHYQGFSHRLDQLLFTNKYLKCNTLILPKVQKTTQPFGHLSLSPLYSRSVIEWCAQMPIDVKYFRLKEKFILKQAFHGKIPELIIMRKKSGMRVPLRFWNERAVKNFHKKILMDKKNPWVGFFFNREGIKSLIKRDHPRKGLKLWMICSFVLTVSQLYDFND